MELLPETTGHEDGVQNISVVTDVINDCNLHCQYCHPLSTGKWGGEMLTADQIHDVLSTSEDMGELEVVLSGGEITMHPEFNRIMDSTRALGNTAVTIITNATRIDQNIVDRISESGVDRICVSVDGPTADMHNSRRGHNFDQVMEGLHALKDTGRPVTVISVLDRRTYPRILELTELLADQGLANQHHMCAPTYSGSAKRTYDRYALHEGDYYEVQSSIDAAYADLQRRGMYVTFNSFWPVTGEHGASDAPRTLTLGQLRERVKDLYTIIRPNGDVRTTAAGWGRETVGNAVVGNLNDEPASDLLKRVDDAYRSGSVLQMPREVEAGHKFQVGPYAGKLMTNALIADKSAPLEESSLPVDTKHISPLPQMDLLKNALPDDDISNLAQEVASDPQRWRLLRHRTGIDLLFDRQTSQTTLLKPDETTKLQTIYATHTA